MKNSSVNQLLQLKQEYLEQQNMFAEMLSKAKAQAVRSILTKGCAANVFPFEWELTGKGKLNAIEVECIPLKTMSSSYFCTHFNSLGQVTLMEQWAFGKFRYFNVYLYDENLIKRFTGDIPMPADSSYELQSISLLELDSSNPARVYSYSPISANTFTGQYIYKNGMLVEYIVHSGNEKESYSFVYDNEDLLSQIICSFSSETAKQQIYPRPRWIKTNN